MPIDEIKQCPKCGSDNIEVKTERDVEDIWMWRDKQKKKGPTWSIEIDKRVIITCFNCKNIRYIFPHVNITEDRKANDFELEYDLRFANRSK